MFFWIWLVGFTIVWIVCKIGRDENNDNEWSDVGLSLFCSLLSWATIIVCLFIYGLATFLDYIDNRKPPKWL